MGIHLLSVVGGRLSTLDHMLDHYIRMGIDSVELHVNASKEDDPIVERVRYAAGLRGIVPKHAIGPWEKTQHMVLGYVSSAPRTEWFVVADQDELHEYVDDIRNIVGYCERHGYDYVRGTFVDRFSRNGKLSKVMAEPSLSYQFPVGAFFTKPVLGGSPMKVAVVRGGVAFTNCGHHRTVGGTPCLPHEFFIQVNHFKWTDGLTEYLKHRSEYAVASRAVTNEDATFLRYWARNGNTIDLRDRRILAAECNPIYSHWSTVMQICRMLDRGVGW